MKPTHSSECKYCNIREDQEDLLKDDSGNFFHQSCEDAFEYDYNEWCALRHEEEPVQEAV